MLSATAWASVPSKSNSVVGTLLTDKRTRLDFQTSNLARIRTRAESPDVDDFLATVTIVGSDRLGFFFTNMRQKYAFFPLRPTKTGGRKTSKVLFVK